MKNRSRNFHPLILSSTCLLAFILLAVLVQKHLTTGFDQLFLHIDKHLPHGAKQAAKTISDIASPKNDLTAAIILFVITVLICIFIGKQARRIRDVLFFAGNIVLAFASNEILKPFFHRVRPSGETGSFSFPSDHAMLAFAFFISLAIILCKYIDKKPVQWLIWILSIICTVGIGFSRVYLQKHYMTDIIGGYLFSAFLLGILYLLTQSTQKHPKFRAT